MQKLLDVGCGISILDSGYMQGNVVAMYLLRQENQVCVIETGTKHSSAYLQQFLQKQGLNFSDIRYIIPTHLHLDHAAGAGNLMRLCTNARLVIHPRGVRHMVDPSKLIASTIAVYGEAKFNKLYGSVYPVKIERIIVAGDNFKLDFNGRELEFIDTPGHAKHHFCIWDKFSQSMFTGDTCGVSYREFDIGDKVFIFPTTTPTQFEPVAMIKSINKIMQYKPKYLCLTHFGAIKSANKVIKQLKDSIYSISNIVKNNNINANCHQKIENLMMQYLLQGLQEMGHKNLDFCKQKLSNDVFLNTLGLIHWRKQTYFGVS